MKKRIFYVFIILVCILFLYNIFLKYYIEINPLKNFSSDYIHSIGFEEYTASRKYIWNESKDIEKNKIIFEYLKSLKLIQIKEPSAIINSNRLSIIINFEDNGENTIYINEIYENNNPITFELRYIKYNTKVSEYYKIINKNFKYEDLKNLIK